MFTIDVPFQNAVYPVLVSVKEQGTDFCCTVRYIHKKIKHILPGDQLVFCLQNGLKEPKNLPNELARNLFLCTSTALQNYFAQKA